ncbi:MAG: feruloyl-CoA synthase [Rhizobiaceae bacterium]|nr:feruloyl-CoA synthase [Rhizobiaceae bacterium]
MKPVNMGRLSVEARRDGDVIYLSASDALPPYARSLIDCLDHWADAAPERTLFADRGPDGAWRHLSYAQASEQSRAIAQYLLDCGLSVDRPVAVLSGNSIEHALVALGAMRAGVPVAPVSPAYSLVAQDYAKLRHVFGLVTPGLVFAAEGKPFEAALAAVMQPGMALVNARNALPGAVSFDTLLATTPTAAVDDANRAVNGDTVAKFLFTSGSTGMPKAVVNTQRMICANQVMIAEALAFLKDKPPVMVDWLPWNHTAGGNHNFGIALYNGGTLNIDDGNPTPGGIAKTVRNLEEIAPTLYFNVPKGYEMLVDHLARNDHLRKNFFSQVELLQYAGAGLPQHVWTALEMLSVETTGKKVMIITGYGSTETAPFALTTTWPVDRPGEVGLPAPGLELKLVPNEGKLELRLKGPNVTPGYWRQPDKTAESFDDEGFYKIGDALKFVDPDEPRRGLLFDGRVAEDFKLSTGTWVNMSTVRGSVISAFAPYVRDAVLTGLDRGYIGAMLFLDVDAARKMTPEHAQASEAELAANPALRAEFQGRLDALAATSTGSSNRVARIVVLDRPPSIDLNEVTDKGSINQRAVMAARADLVEDLYAEPSPSHVLVARKERTQ